MVKNINLQNILKALLISFSFVLVLNNLSNGNNIYLNQNLFISLLIYSVLSFIAIHGYAMNKIIGIVLFFSITLLAPNLYPRFEGELFPITYVVFSMFLTYRVGVEMFKKWKSRF